MRSGALYRSVRAALLADLDGLPAEAASVDVRVFGGTHPFVDVDVTTTVREIVSRRTLSIARYREGTLEGGFLEADA